MRFTKYYISLAMLLSLFVFSGCTVDVIDRGFDDDEDGDDAFVVEWMDGLLSTHYLYNDEYNNMSRDLTLSYDMFLDVTLKSMTTNVLDYKDGEIYTNVLRVASTKSGTRVSDSKQSVITMGLAKAMLVEYNNSNKRGLAVCAVYPDSPFAKAGVTRGMIITSVRGTELTESNIDGWAQLLLEPTVSNLSYSLIFEDGTEKTIYSTTMECNPVTNVYVYEEGNKKIGYLSYISFDAAWDTELLSALEGLKTEGITDLILDLRLNGGGYVSSANKLAASLGGDSAMSDDIFTYYTYNPTRMAALGGNPKVEYFSDRVSSSKLNLPRLICLVSGSTASASELVINSLRGVGFEVVLIGEQTEGKNVGMEVFNKSYNSYDYEFLPISFILSNVEDYTQNDYSAGLEVDYEQSDWGSTGGYFKDFGRDEILISTAINYITTGSFPAQQMVALATRATSAELSKSKGGVLAPTSAVSGNIYLGE